MSTVPAHQWRAVIEAALASRRADCGHALSLAASALVWLRTTRVNGVTEVWSVCVDCHVEGKDYQYQADRPETPPTRIREETL